MEIFQRNRIIQDLNPLEIKDFPPNEIVTVVFFSFRRLEGLKNSIEGFLRSTLFKGIWIIIMDCGTTDETREYIGSIVPHCGAVFMTPAAYSLDLAIKIAMKYVLGDWIIFFDDDLEFIVEPNDTFIEEGIDLLTTYSDILCSINLHSKHYFDHIGHPSSLGKELMTPNGTKGYIFYWPDGYKITHGHLAPMKLIQQCVPQMYSGLPENDFKRIITPMNLELAVLDRPLHGVMHPIKGWTEYGSTRSVTGIWKLYVPFSFGACIYKD